ncbi:hypothetical protein [Viridibacillus arvi]|uniref:hypothetical protein n=1 Tax=Viridibacillus arvi TaxID=263475 RepID=UPI003D27CA71
MLDLGEKISGIFESLIQFLFDSLAAPFKVLPSLKELVFGKTEKNLIWSTFYEKDLTKAFSPVFNTMTTIAFIALVLFIVFAGMRITSSSLMANRRNEIFESAKDLLLVVILLFNLPLIYDILFQINDGFIKIFSSAYKSKMDEFKADDESAGVIGNIFISLILLGLAIWANFFYMMRRVTLIILMGIGPIMVVCWMFPRWKGVTQAWFKELTGTIFVQSIHAGVFWVLTIISATADGFVASVIVLVIFIPITESVRKLLGMGGDMQGGLSRAGSMMGLNALGVMAGAVKGAAGDQSVLGAIKGAGKKAIGATKGGATGEEGDDVAKTKGASAGSDIGTNTNAEKMLKSGDILSKMGKAVLGSAGAIAGSATGPVGSMIGAQGGLMVGGAVGGLLGRNTAAGVMAMADRLKAGKNAVSDMKESQSKDFDEGMANLMATDGANKWATDNKDAVMSGLKQKFPDATQKELDSKFEQMKADKKDALMGEAKDQWSNAQGLAGKVAKGGSLVGASASAMAKQWGDNNKEDFLKDYDNKNPQQPGESDSDFAIRRMNAFSDKISSMKDKFTSAGKAYADKFGGSDTPISREGFNNHMSNAIKGIKDIGDSNGLASASAEAVEGVSGANMFSNNGIPNNSVIANSLAHAKTNGMKKQFMAQQTSAGISEADANKNWSAQEGSVHSANLAKYESAGFQNSVQELRKATLPANKATALASAAVVASSAALGIPEMKQAAGAVSAGLSVGMQSLAEGSKSNGLIRSTPTAISDGFQAMANQRIASNDNNAVQTEANFVNSAGMAGGLLLGAKGYQASKTFAMKHSPYKQQVESQISSPSEVIQMAQTITDDNGNTRIAPGAIRQVITPNSSHIEVLTKSGERQVVSRMSSGHSGMQKGDTVYQDLDVSNNTLVPMNNNAGNSGSTYRLDSGGARIPSSVKLSADSNKLLGNPLRSDTHAPINRQQAPVFNQAVDSGNFYVDNVASEGMSNLQVVMDKGSQYVTAQKGDKTYRVSPVFAGDTRLNKGESVSIPVSIQNNRLTASSNFDNAVVEGDSNTPIDYYSSNGVDGMMFNQEMLQSKHSKHAKKSVERRALLEEVRRKQGLLG